MTVVLSEDPSAVETVEATSADGPIRIAGTILAELPKDLYIPPDAMRVLLEETFEGPLDLLLYLIKRQNLDILDIPIAEITRQYVAYVEFMHELRFELAAEYMVMAAMLAEIKSRMLLPKPKEEEAAEAEDPRAELVRRLQEYERFKKAAEELDNLPRVEREIFIAQSAPPDFSIVIPKPTVRLEELVAIVREVLKRAKLFSDHQIKREMLSVRARMSEVLQRLQTVSGGGYVQFAALFTPEEGRMGVVVTFVAILELQKQSAITITQNEAFAPIYVQASQVND